MATANAAARVPDPGGHGTGWGSTNYQRCGGKGLEGGREGEVALRQGRLLPRVLALIVEWGQQRQAELLANWDRLQRGQPPLPVPPLE